MNIIRPTLPPKIGYVESRDTEGNPIYIPTAETLERQRLENENEDLKVQVGALTLKSAQFQADVDYIAMETGVVLDV